MMIPDSGFLFLGHPVYTNGDKSDKSFAGKGARVCFCTVSGIQFSYNVKTVPTV